MLRLTAKATQFGHRTFTSWLIESAGTVPIKRKRDAQDGNVDNSEAMEYLMQVCVYAATLPDLLPFIRHIKIIAGVRVG